MCVSVVRVTFPKDVFATLNTLYGIIQYFWHVCVWSLNMCLSFLMPKVWFCGFSLFNIFSLTHSSENLTWAVIFLYVNNVSTKYVMSTLIFSYVNNVFQKYVIHVLPKWIFRNLTWVKFLMSKMYPKNVAQNRFCRNMHIITFCTLQ